MAGSGLSGEKVTRILCGSFPFFAGILACPWLVNGAVQPGEQSIEIWHGDEQRVGHLGDAQDDFNVLGHVRPWTDVDTLSYSLNGLDSTPLSFRAFRRIAADGDFNADVPVAKLRPGANTVTIRAKFVDGVTLEREVNVIKYPTGRRPLPVTIRWDEVTDPQDVGQYVDGRWNLTPDGLHISRIGYDRLFLIGERSWQDYEVFTTVTVHEIRREAPPRWAGVGLVLRFTGHVVGGPLLFPSAQPKWGYLPLGAIGWLRWSAENLDAAPHAQYFPGDSNNWINFDQIEFHPGATYKMRMDCKTLPDDSAGRGVTHYRYKVWNAADPEPSEWAWEMTQVSDVALRQGGVVLLAHHVDATFGDVSIVAR